MRFARPAVSLLLVALTATACSRGAAPQKVTAPPAPAATQTPAAPNTARAAAAVKTADALMVRGEYKLGVTVLLETLGEFPDYAPAWDLLTFGYNRLELYKAAKMAALRSMALDPKPAGARFNAGLALAFAEGSNLELATKHLEAAGAANRQPYTFYLLSGVLQRSGKESEAKSTLLNALGHFPDNKDLKRALAALERDLNLDGKPEQISSDQGLVRVVDGAKGTELLTWKAEQPNIQVYVVDIGGDVPVLVADKPPFYATVFGWTGTALTEWGRAFGTVHPDVVARVLVASHMDKVQQTIIGSHYRAERGALKIVRVTTDTFKGGSPPPADLVGLNDTLNSSYSSAFAAGADSVLIDKLQADSPLPARGLVLLPEPGGSYRLEVHAEGAVKATAKAAVTAEGRTFLIKELSWK